MKKGFKLIVPSLLAIIVCVLLLAGSTFALFTSDVTKNIVVGSATVNMTAEYTEFKAYSVEATDNNTSDDYAGEATAYGVTSHYNYVEVSANSETAKTFANKGTATLTNENTITLVNVTPGDRITANLKVTNNSNVDIIYRVRLNAISDNGLLDGLTVKAGGETLTGVIKVGEWTPWNVPTEQTKVQDIALEVFLPVEAGNEYQTKQATLRFTIEAVQANAKTDTLLDQVNAYLATHDGNDDGKNDVNNTMYDAIQEVKGNTELAAFDATKYLWSPDTDQFYAPYTVVAGFESHFFKAYLQAEFNELTEQKYNIYAIGEWTGSINITVGFDAGEATGITSINYDRHDATTAQKVVIRTNGGTLTVKAPLDTVKHYGNADKVDVQEIANASYHEFGDVDLVKVKKGHVELEQGSAVLGIYVYNDSTETVKATSFENIKITVNQGVEVPALSRSAVEIQDGGTKVCTIVTDEAKDVYLFNEGIYEQIKVVDEGKAITDESATWADDNSNSANTQTAAQQLANELNATVTVNDVEYTVAVNTESESRELVVTVKDTGAAADSSVVNSVKENAVNQSGSTEEDAVADLPLRGDGLSWETAFEVYDYNTMQKISEYANLGGYYYKVNIDKCATIDGKKVIDCSNWKSVSLYGNFDGSGVSFINMNRPLFGDVYAIGSNFNLPTYDAVTIVKNFTVSNCDIRYDNSYYVGAVVHWACDSIEFDNIEVSGYLSANGIGSFLGQSNGYDWSANSGNSGNVPVCITFRDCHSSMELVSGSQTGGFIGNVCWSANKESYLNSSVNIIDSYFNGSMTHGSSYRSAYVHAHSIYDETFVNFTYSAGKPNYSYLYYNVPNGKSINYLYAWVYNGATESVQTVSIDKPSTGNYISGTALENATTVKVYLCIGTNPGNATYNYIVETINVTNDKNFTTSQIKNFDTIQLVNGGQFGSYTIEGNTLTVDSGSRTDLAGASVRIDQFDSNGNLIAVSNLSINN